MSNGQGGEQQQTQEMQKMRRLKKNELLEQRNELGERMDTQLKPKVCAMENRLHSMRSFADQRMESLRGFDVKLYDAVMWLRENMDESMFEGRVYEPMLLELNVKRKEHVQYFENTISKNDFTAFTCDNTNDAVVLHRLLTENGMRCNVLYSAPANEVRYEPSKPIASIQHLGFHAYLLQLVDGPVPILNYICKMYGVHNIPVGDARARQNLARIQSEVSLPIMFVDNLRVFAKRSVYSNDMVRGTDTIQSRNWLTVGVDEAVIEEQERQLRKMKLDLDMMRNKRTQLESEIEYLDTKEREWKTAQSRVTAKLNKVKAKKTQLNNLTAKIKEIKALPTCEY